ncbi:hypothetical protein F2P56_026881, partial [Juglans regia]
MAEELTRQWKNFKLTEQESTEMVLPSDTMEMAMHQGKFCLLGMIIAEKPINKEAFRNTMIKVWKSEGWVQFTEVGENSFLIEFNKDEDRQCVIKGLPWSFDRWLLCLHAFEGNMPVNDIQFTREEFWLQVHNMPLGTMTEE